MGYKFVSVAILAAVLGSASLQAQSVSQIGGPANAPPAGFTGQQFVDNRGCVFLKAGYGGQSAWVPRVGRDRKAMCGFPPTGTRAKIEVATAEEMAKPAIDAAPVVAARPTVLAAIEPVMPVMRAQPVLTAPTYAPSYAPVLQPRPVYVPPAQTTVAAAPAVRQPAPYVEAAPRGTYETVAAAGPGRGQVGCFASAPVAERVKLRNGGTAVVCTRGDGTLTGWRSPVYARSAGVGAALTDPVLAGNGGNGHSAGNHSAGSHSNGYASGDQGQSGYATARADQVPTPPKGYKMAWNDDRLNANRGKGTLSGWQDQDQVWTHDVPAKLVADVPVNKRKKKVVYVQKGSQVVVSTKGQAATAPVQQKQVNKKPAAKGGAYIQVGTFGVPANADGAASRLQGAGLPVARAKITSGGKAMQIVLAGPFSTAEDAQVALSMARRVGFGDAFIR